MLQYEHVFFEPWIGSDYKGSGLWNRKVLVVGESHYNRFHSDKSDASRGIEKPQQTLERNETINCITEVITGEGGSPFWTSIRNRIGGLEHREAPADEFWKKVAFYNFVQTPVDGASRVAPTREQFANSILAFEEVVDKLNPDRIIITGDRIHRYVPFRPGKWPDQHDEDTRIRIPIEYFVHRSGKKNYVTMTSHPTSSYFYNQLSPLFRYFIDHDWDTDETSTWTPDVLERTRRALRGEEFLTALGYLVDFKHPTKGTASIRNEDIKNGVFILTNKENQSTTTYGNIEGILADGWLVD